MHESLAPNSFSLSKVHDGAVTLPLAQLRHQRPKLMMKMRALTRKSRETLTQKVNLRTHKAELVKLSKQTAPKTFTRTFRIA